MKLRTKFLAAILAAALIPLIAFSVYVHLRYRSDLEQSVRSHLQSVAAIQQSRLSAILLQNEERLALIASRTQLRLSLDRHLQEGDEASRERMGRILADAASSIPDITRISVYSPAGVVVADTDAARIGDPHFDPAVLDRTLRETIVDDIFLDDDGRTGVRLMGPMLLEDRTLGVIVIRASAENLLASLSDYAGLGETGEAILMRPVADGKHLLLAPTRFDPAAAMTVCPGHGLPPDGYGAGHGTRAVDYRGVDVLASSLPIPGTDWLLVVKMDRDEAFAGPRDTARLALGIEAMLLVLVVVVTVRLSSRLTAPLVKLSAAAEDIAAGNYGRTVTVESSDEIGTLEAGFNTMSTAVRQAEQELQRKIEQLNGEIEERERIEQERTGLIEDLQRAMSEIKSLQGIIPICAECKKIRDDKGYWNQLETYLRDHSEAEFSHGLCPTCLDAFEKDLDAFLPADADEPGEPGEPDTGGRR